MSRLLSRVLAWRPPRLGFEPELERRFQKVQHAARLRHFIISGWVALLVFNVFLLTDRLMVPDVYALAWHVRLLIFTPFGLSLLMVAIFFRGFVLNRSMNFLEFVVALSGVGAAISLMTILQASASPMALLYHAGLMPIVVYGNLVQRQKFVWALASSVTICVLMGASLLNALQREQVYGGAVALLLCLVVLMISAYTLFMNFRMELEDRRRFLGVDRAATLRQQLEQSRVEFATLSRQDALTALPNRRCFDEVMGLAWAAHDQKARSLTLLLLDVDHFKAFNDRYGHSAGDQCLKLLARALQDAVTAEGGTLARWGGEEFAVLLPGVRLGEAERIAARLCAVVSGLCLRHEASGTSAVVTVSVGGACGVPEVAGVSTTNALWLADQALYRAKSEGRNRWALQVWPAPTLNLAARTAVQTPGPLAPVPGLEPVATGLANAAPRP
jgi:diguanylate cyclase (GGDEF)-like protein